MIDYTSLMLEKVSHFLTKKIVKQINKLAAIDRVPYETYLKIKEFVGKHLVAKSATVAVVNKPMCLLDECCHKVKKLLGGVGVFMSEESKS